MTRLPDTLPDMLPDTVPDTLVVLPHAGGSSAGYRRLLRHLPDRPVVWLDRPGGGRRRSEQLLTRPDDIVADHLDQVRRAVDPTSGVVLYGHSLGAAIAASLAARLEESASGCARLVVSGRNAPGHPHPLRTLADADDPGLVSALGRLGGRESVVLDDPDLAALFLPAVRAELRLAADWPDDPARRLGCPVTVVPLADDPATSAEGLAGWDAVGAGPACRHPLPGGHFGIEADDGRGLARILVQHLDLPREHRCVTGARGQDQGQLALDPGASVATKSSLSSTGGGMTNG